VINNQKDIIMGGYRQGSGRSKSGYYKGIYCGSTYELCWVIHSLDHSVKFNRFPGKLESNGIVYYPDFLLDDGKTIIETKGYEAQESVDKKSKVAESLGYSVKVLRKKDLEYAFKYVQETYNTTKFFTLYDEYKPTYSYTCSHCKTEYKTDNVLKTDTGFCSRSCAGKFRKKHNKPPSNLETANYKRALSKEKALEIFYRSDKSLKELADEYNITKNTVWFLKQKKSYKWIHD
jgi:predicted nucleic acid-binding Zn ribbon protein